MLIAPRPIASNVRKLAREFLSALADGNSALVWETMITLDAIELVSTATFPIAIRKGDMKQALRNTSIDQLSLAFQLDAKNIRSEFFQGFTTSLRNMGWMEPFDDNASYVFLWHDAALLVVQRADGKPTILPFVVDSLGTYKVDFEAILAFSMYISASQLHGLGTDAIESGQLRTATSIYEVAARLRTTYTRLRRLMWDHPIVGEMITSGRKRELQAELAYAILAGDQVEQLQRDPQFFNAVIDISHFMSEFFRGYSDVSNTDIDEDDLTKLIAMNDNELRTVIAKILVGVDRVEADREARKPHSSAEFADMEIMLKLGGELYHLLMPVKSGREIRTTSVPVSVFYQILRPHLFFRHGVVVFVTAKPCSQPLMNLIKLARDRHGWPIGVIEHADLARLLKLNNQL